MANVPLAVTVRAASSGHAEMTVQKGPITQPVVSTTTFTVEVHQPNEEGHTLVRVIDQDGHEFDADVGTDLDDAGLAVAEILVRRLKSAD